MILPVFAIYDSKAQYYGTPWTQPNLQVAKRAFADIASEPGNPVFNNPTDFSLVEIGEFNDETAVITACDHINYGSADQYKKV